MTPFLESFFRENFRKILLRLLIFTEKKTEDKPAATRKQSLLHRDIHIPPILVAVVSTCFLIIILAFGVGWSWKSFLSLTVFVLLTLSLFIFYLKHDFPKLIQDDEAMML